MSEEIKFRRALILGVAAVAGSSFAIVKDSMPIPEAWRLPIVASALFLTVISVAMYCFLYFGKASYSHRKDLKPMTLIIVAFSGALLAVGCWLLTDKVIKAANNGHQIGNKPDSSNASAPELNSEIKSPTPTPPSSSPPAPIQNSTITSHNQSGGFTGINAGTVNIGPVLNRNDDSTDKIIANQDKSKAEIIEEVRSILKTKNESLRDKLNDQFPDGYVLFAGKGEVSMPFPNGDLRVDADWSKTKILIDPATKKVEAAIPQPTWKGPGIHIQVTQAAEWSGKYSVGIPTPIRFIKAKGQPNMYFEVLDENNHIYAIGFKKDSD